MKKQNGGERAFTLVEALIVLVIVVLVLIMALPALKRIYDARTQKSAPADQSAPAKP
jgi:type II secretory pathway pseudopilin PulG